VQSVIDAHRPNSAENGRMVKAARYAQEFVGWLGQKPWPTRGRCLGALVATLGSSDVGTLGDVGWTAVSVPMEQVGE
jgi:hypothetical protein